MMGEMFKRREISANRRREKQALFHPWGVGYGNPSFSGSNTKSDFIKNLNGSQIQQRMPHRSGLRNAGSYFRDIGKGKSKLSNKKSKNYLKNLKKIVKRKRKYIVNFVLIGNI